MEMTPRRLRIIIGCVIAVVLVAALVMASRGGDVQGQDDYPEGAQVKAAVVAVDGDGTRQKSQPDTFVATLTRVGQTPPVPKTGMRTGAGTITFFGVEPGRYVLRLVEPKGQTARIRVDENAVLERALTACVGAGCR